MNSRVYLPSPIHSLASLGDLEGLKRSILINKSEMRTTSHKMDIDRKNKHGMTALHSACYYGRLNVVKYLLEEGADVNSYSGSTGENASESCVVATPLHLAACNGHKYLVQMLMENGADPNKPDFKGFSPLEVAKMNNHKKTASIIEKFTQSLIHEKDRK